MLSFEFKSEYFWLHYPSKICSDCAWENCFPFHVSHCAWCAEFQRIRKCFKSVLMVCDVSL